MNIELLIEIMTAITDMPIKYWQIVLRGSWRGMEFLPNGYVQLGEKEDRCAQVICRVAEAAEIFETRGWIEPNDRRRFFCDFCFSDGYLEDDASCPFCEATKLSVVPWSMSKLVALVATQDIATTRTVESLYDEFVSNTHGVIGWDITEYAGSFDRPIPRSILTEKRKRLATKIASQDVFFGYYDNPKTDIPFLGIQDPFVIET